MECRFDSGHRDCPHAKDLRRFGVSPLLIVTGRITTSHQWALQNQRLFVGSGYWMWLLIHFGRGAGGRFGRF